jgi:four helix bundle protein
MGDHTELRAWQRAVDLVVEVYRCTASFPNQETYGLTSQMRRAAVSVPSNIAEGKGRFSRKELLQFLFRARGSLLELETQIMIGEKLGFLDAGNGQKLRSLASDVARQLNGLIKSFEKLVHPKPDTRNPTPRDLTPETLTPETLTPETLTPETLTPETRMLSSLSCAAGSDFFCF